MIWISPRTGPGRGVCPPPRRADHLGGSSATRERGAEHTQDLSGNPVRRLRGRHAVFAERARLVLNLQGQRRRLQLRAGRGDWCCRGTRRMARSSQWIPKGLGIEKGRTARQPARFVGGAEAVDGGRWLAVGKKLVRGQSSSNRERHHAADGGLRSGNPPTSSGPAWARRCRQRTSTKDRTWGLPKKDPIFVLRVQWSRGGGDDQQGRPLRRAALRRPAPPMVRPAS